MVTHGILPPEVGVCPACGYDPGTDRVAQAKSLLRSVALVREFERSLPPRTHSFGYHLVESAVLVVVLVVFVAHAYL